MPDLILKIKTFLQGKKSYIIAATTIAIGWISYLTDVPILGIEVTDLGTAVNYTLAGLGLSTLRAGIGTK